MPQLLLRAQTFLNANSCDVTLARDLRWIPTTEDVPKHSTSRSLYYWAAAALLVAVVLGSREVSLLRRGGCHHHRALAESES